MEVNIQKQAKARSAPMPRTLVVTSVDAQNPNGSIYETSSATNTNLP